ncbi:MAG: Shikimate/quinate 5-dehydrogenase [Parcubacteria group bacterium GW2011_GWC2_42_11]|nr:MAG: Shikimate/quinate 5-dehydrogenase [Parcubacteria group bacterium GW2011_GWC2_42_11]
MSNKHTIHNKTDKAKHEYDFAFLVHPRNIQDIYKKFPFFKIIPVVLFMFFFKNISPVILATVRGAVDENGKKIKGVIISLPITAEQMLRDRNQAKKQVFRAIKKAKKLGATYVGLGSFTSVVTSGGEDVRGLVEGVHVTNGNALTTSMTYLGIQDLIRNSLFQNQT